MASDLGYNPQGDGRVIRINVPALSGEVRKKMVTRIKELAEETKVSIRNVRRDGNKAAEQGEKDKDLTEDDRDSLKEHDAAFESAKTMLLSASQKMTTLRQDAEFAHAYTKARGLIVERCFHMFPVGVKGFEIDMRVRVPPREQLSAPFLQHVRIDVVRRRVEAAIGRLLRLVARRNLLHTHGWHLFQHLLRVRGEELPRLRLFAEILNHFDWGVGPGIEIHFIFHLEFP